MATSSGVLPKIYLEITNVCNLRCPFCPPTKRKGEFMSRQDFELYLGKLEGRCDRLYFHVKGEPLLHPELGDFLSLAGKRGFSVSLTTNGTLLADKAELLLDSPALCRLSVSLHSHVVKDGAGEGRAGGEELEEYWRGVASFLDRHRATRPFPVSLRLWNRSSGNLPPETERLWELMRERYPEAEAWGAASSARDSLRLDDKVFLNQAELFAWPEAKPEAEHGTEAPRAEGEAAGADSGGFCRGLRNQVAVLVDGSVVPCCLDGEGVMRLGYLRNSSLEEILASPRARAIYEGFSRREAVEPLCRGCGYRKRFS
jgi:MoaA/NifB/PqqE/SkfB family radical SAM enzyme